MNGIVGEAGGEGGGAKRELEARSARRGGKARSAGGANVPSAAPGERKALRRTQSFCSRYDHLTHGLALRIDSVKCSKLTPFPSLPSTAGNAK